jgi:membrane associated rhomboid family serine protease
MVLPIGDINPATRRAFVMGLIALANVGVAVWQFTLEGCDQIAFLYQWSAIPRELTTMAPLSTDAIAQHPAFGECADHLGDKLVPLSAVTAMFLHGGLAHLLGNMIFLLVFGNNVEDRLGHVRFVVFYVVGGIVATVAFVAIRPDSVMPMVGASGAIAAVLGAYLVCFPRARVLTIVTFPLYLIALVLPRVRIERFLLIVAIVGMPAWLLLTGWLALQFQASRAPGVDQVAYEAHIGGFLAGIVLLLLLDRRRARRGQATYHPVRRRR